MRRKILILCKKYIMKAGTIIINLIIVPACFTVNKQTVLVHFQLYSHLIHTTSDELADGAAKCVYKKTRIKATNEPVWKLIISIFIPAFFISCTDIWPN